MSVHRRRGGIILLSALVLDSIGTGMFMPLSLLYFPKLTAAPLELIGVLASVATAVTLPIPALVGWLADRVGPLPLVVAAQLAQGIGFLAFGRVHGPVGMFLASALVTTGVRIFWSCVFTAIADYADGSTSTTSEDGWHAWANMTRTGGLGIGGLIATLGTGRCLAGPGPAQPGRADGDADAAANRAGSGSAGRRAGAGARLSQSRRVSRGVSTACPVASSRRTT